MPGIRVLVVDDSVVVRRVLHLNRPAARPPKSGVQVKMVDLQYQAKS